MIIKLNCNLLTGATKLFISTLHPNSLNCSLASGGGILTALGCLHCVPVQAILNGIYETAASVSSYSAGNWDGKRTCEKRVVLRAERFGGKEPQ